MPKFKCACGETINYGDIPSRHEWLMISDVEYDQFAGNVDSEAVYKAMIHALRCPKCKRLYVFWDGLSESPEVLISASKQD